MASPPSAAAAAAVAAHRFGLGENDLEPIAADAVGWLAAQIGPAEAARGNDLPTTAQALARVQQAEEQRRRARNAPPPTLVAGATPAPADEPNAYRELIVADTRSRLLSAVAATRPFAERLALFWANHFTVSMTKGSTRGLIGAFEREAIRPHIAGSFEQLLWAATTHPAMLRYLDNQQSAGPHSRIVARAARRAQATGEGARVTGLNENLAREVLELHTLGVNGGYTQADVTAFAAVLTGWRVTPRDLQAAVPFDADWHEPGRKTVLGVSYPEGQQALRRALADLARHPSTARFLATKLARHFVADDPPAALVERLADSYRRSDGQLGEVYRTLLRSPEAWSAAPLKLKTPEEFVVATVRLLGLAERTATGDSLPNLPNLLFSGSGTLGQRMHLAPSPAGWPDRAEEWLGPEAVWKRVEWATRVGDRLGRSVDARMLADRSLGPWLAAGTRQQIARAADGPQALTLLLMAPEFQRR